jgi:hypothetical protein
MIVVTAAILLAPVSVVGDPDLLERTLLGGRLSILVPNSFTQMSEEMLRVKYPSERRPTIVLTNPEGSVNVAVNHTSNALPPSQLRQAHTAMETTFRNLYPSAEWNRSEIVTLKGRSYFVLDLRTPAIDTEVRNIMAGTSLDDRFLIITFNCTHELEPQWAGIGKRIIESVRLEE